MESFFETKLCLELKKGHRKQHREGCRFLTRYIGYVDPTCFLPMLPPKRVSRQSLYVFMFLPCPNQLDFTCTRFPVSLPAWPRSSATGPVPLFCIFAPRTRDSCQVLNQALCRAHRSPSGCVVLYQTGMATFLWWSFTTGHKKNDSTRYSIQDRSCEEDEEEEEAVDEIEDHNILIKSKSPQCRHRLYMFQYAEVILTSKTWLAGINLDKDKEAAIRAQMRASTRTSGFQA